MSFVLISLFTLHVLFGCLIPWTVTLFIFSFCCTLYWFLQVYCIYCKRGHWWWSLTGLILFTLCVCVCLKSVKDSSRCKRREEQECFRLANCRSCSLNVNCQWELQQQECQALPGEETHAIMKAHTAVARNMRMFSYLKFEIWIRLHNISLVMASSDRHGDPENEKRVSVTNICHFVLPFYS